MIKAIILLNLASFGISTDFMGIVRRAADPFHDIRPLCTEFFSHKAATVAALSFSLPRMVNLFTPRAPWLGGGGIKPEQSFVPHMRNLSDFVTRWNDEAPSISTTCDSPAVFSENMFADEIVKMDQVIEGLQAIEREMNTVERSNAGWWARYRFPQVKRGMSDVLAQCRQFVNRYKKLRQEDNTV